MIHFRFNDQTITCEPGKTVLEAVQPEGIQIPTLCYHPALKSSGSCKLCTVEVGTGDGLKKLRLSCVLKAKEGMIVRNDTLGVHQALRKAFKRLHTMAPLSRRIQELAAAHGVDLPGPPDGCIGCSLCVRVCQDVVGAKALRMEKVGDRPRVMTVPGRCSGCGTCANLCPTQVFRIVDREGTRKIYIRDELIGQAALERCHGCGKYYATHQQVVLAEDPIRPHVRAKHDHHYCPTCAKLFSQRLQAIDKHLVRQPVKKQTHGSGEKP